jgi:proteic killer suppression protein
MYDGVVIRSFTDRATEDVFYGEDSKRARRLPKTLWPLIRRKLDVLQAAACLEDLGTPPGNRLEALARDRSGRYSIRVNDQYRLTFRFEDGDAWEVKCEDYH